MNAEALIGTVLGTCTLQKLVGQGGMGAVFLAQQSRPRRQVAVKVLLPMTPLSPHQLAAFLERFRRETDAAASLEHPNIMPVHEYGEANGQAYLVMPYVSGGTLRDEMEREGPLPLARVANYLEQIAAALDFAHEHGVIHRDVKPANMMLTSENRLLLTDFGLVKIITEGQTPQIRLTGAGAPVGTPDYMAPEQVIGEEIDTRADLYSLGVILFQMVTGTTPFHGETPMQIAAQHLQMPPPSAQVFRPDLPVAAEQVIQRALAKRPVDRYMLAQDLANAFRSALMLSGIQLDPSYIGSYVGGVPGNNTSSWSAIPKGQFEPIRQTGTLPRVERTGLLSRTGLLPTVKQTPDTGGALPAVTGAMPATASADESRGMGGGLLSRTGKFPTIGTSAMPPVTSESTQLGGGLLSRTGKFPVGGATGAMPTSWATSSVTPAEQRPVPLTVKTPDTFSYEDDALLDFPFSSSSVAGVKSGEQEPQTEASTVKLTGPMKIVKVPVAGQPGQYVTGLLPVADLPAEEPAQAPKRRMHPVAKIVLAVVVLLLVFTSVGVVFFAHGNVPLLSTTHTTGKKTVSTTPSSPMARATATAQANIIFSDPLSQNIHNWQTSPASAYAFKDGAYHISVDQNTTGRATILPDSVYGSPLGYQLTMQEVRGDDTQASNSFGMIFRFTQKNVGGKQITTFYSFEVVNIKGGSYQFWKYDNTDPNNPWSQIGQDQPFGNEFHQGQGPQAANTIKVFMNEDKFTITVNGQQLPTTYQDGSLKEGTVGMLVNRNGTEVAFKDMLLTKN